ncbi:hypothetical protein [Pediococcus acidilactici]|uniref:hypothetical protein n=1 Tax=Pediococcus acidilactici TaxID=1254 RepID=UPI00155ECE86|nr:hypothetical protein [Pediococcus acidilactici]NRD13609.1 hypothetical protein [Pediococcus acidilactici]
MQFSNEQIMKLIDKHMDATWTEESIQAEMKYVASNIQNSSDTQLNQEQINALANSLQYINKITTKQTLITLFNVFTEMGIFVGSNDQN